MLQKLATRVTDHAVGGTVFAAVGGCGAVVNRPVRCSLVFDAEEQFLGVVADRDAEKLVPLRAQIVVDDLK